MKKKLHPLADCWVQMLLIKRRIKRKSIKLNKYTIEGKERLEAMRKLRNELLNNLRTLIDVKIKKVRSMTGSGGRMMRIYVKWLRKWQKHLKKQQIKLKQLENEEIKLDRQLYLLRNQLGLLPNRRRVLHRYLKGFNDALKHSDNIIGNRSGKKKHVMGMELENIFKFLLKKPVKHSRRYMKSHPISKEHNLEILHFWKHAVHRKKSIQQHKPGKSSVSIGSIGSLNILFQKKSMPQANKRKGKFKLELPTIRKLYHIKKKLYAMARNEVKTLNKSLHSMKRRDSKGRRSKTDEQVSLTDVLDLSVDLREKGFAKNNKKPDKLTGVRSAMRQFHQEMEIQSLISKLSTKSKRKLLRKIAPTSEAVMNGVRASGDSKKSGDKDIGTEEIESIQSKRTRIDLRAKRKAKQGEYKYAEETSDESEVKTEPKHSKKGSRKQKGREKEAKQESKRDIGKELSFNEKSSLFRTKQPSNRQETRDEFEHMDKKHQATSDINDLMKNKSVAAGIHTYSDQKSPHWKLFQRILTSKKKKRMGVELMNMLETNPQPKLQPIQNLLKDVIKGPTMMDIIADRDEIVKLVGKHYMWKNLASVYYDLTSVGVGKPEIYSILKEQYLRYIDEIVVEAIDRGARVVSRSQISSVTDYLSIGGSSDSFEEYLNKSRPKQELAMKKHLNELREYTSQQFTSIHHVTGGHSAISLEIMAYKELQVIDQRYSMTNLKNIHDAHARYFGCLDKLPLSAKTDPNKLQEAAIARELRRNRKSSTSANYKKKKRRQCQKIDNCRLYYEPTKTCRERSIEDDDDGDYEPKTWEDKCECKSECYMGKCARCGVSLPPVINTPEPSSSYLSLCSIAACGKNKELLKLTLDICDQCGFVHEQKKPCPMWIDACTSRTMQQLRLIKQISQSPYIYNQQSSLRAGSSLRGICS